MKPDPAEPDLHLVGDRDASGGPNPGVCCQTPAEGGGVSMSTAWS